MNTLLKKITIKDTGTTWELAPDGDFICVHDGDRHIEMIEYTRYEGETELDFEEPVEICDGCDSPVETFDDDDDPTGLEQDRYKDE